MQQEVDALKQQIESLTGEYYTNNFPSSRDENKYVRFNTRLKVPRSTANPTIGDVGDLVEVGGKLKICTVASVTAPTWTIVGTQT